MAPAFSEAAIYPHVLLLKWTRVKLNLIISLSVAVKFI